MELVLSKDNTFIVYCHLVLFVKYLKNVLSMQMSVLRQWHSEIVATRVKQHVVIPVKCLRIIHHVHQLAIVIVDVIVVIIQVVVISNRPGHCLLDHKQV